MTVKELYEWAKEKGREDYALIVQYRDDGGKYDGNEDVLPSQMPGWGGLIDDKDKTILL